MEESVILRNLNDEQKLPASILDGAILVTAGAGSGKTRMLTHRIAHMVSELKVNPLNILAITFTNKAANEMKERLSKMIEGADYMWVCTFHSMCSRILRYNIDSLGFTKSFSIYGDTEKSRIIKRVMESVKSDINAETYAWHISNAKNNLLSPEKYSKYIKDPKKCFAITKVYQDYEAELFKANALDFDDLIVKTYELFTKFPEVLEMYQNKFKYIFVDEFQDTNTAQYELVKLLAGKYKNILAVGDEDQCIYSWRGAQVENVKRFTKDFPDCKIFKLEQNYRSTKKIIDVANKLIKNNKNRIEKNLWTANDDGTDIQINQPYCDIDEAELIAEKIEQLVSHGLAKYSDFAILLRVNSQSRVIEEKLLNYNIPYKIYGGFKFFERKEIKDTTAYLYLLANPNDTEATNRMLQFPKKGIGDISISLIRQKAEEYGVSEMEIICNAEKYQISGSLKTKLDKIKETFDELSKLKESLSLEEFVVAVIEKVGIKEAIGNKNEDDLNKQLNVDDLVKSVAEYASANEDATIEDFLQSVTLMRDIDSMNDNENFVTMLTVHSAKGLEFDTVFMPGLNDGLFPLSRSINSGDPNELEEERRLMYVGVTRAKRRLFLSRPKLKYNYETRRSENTLISRFLTEMFDNLKTKSTITNGEINRLNVYDNNINNFLLNNKKQESLDHMMSTHINVVNVSNTTTTSSSNTIGTINASEYSKYKKGTLVMHNHFGKGVVTVGVTDFASAFVTINFETVGIKTLSLKYAKLEIID